MKSDNKIDELEHWIKARNLTNRTLDDLKKHYQYSEIKELKDDITQPFYCFFEEVTKMVNHITVSLYKTGKILRRGLNESSAITKSIRNSDISLYLKMDKYENEESFYNELKHMLIHEITHAYQDIDNIFDLTYHEEPKKNKSIVDYFMYLTSIWEIDAELSSFYYLNGDLPETSEWPFGSDLYKFYEKTYNLPGCMTYSVCIFIHRLFTNKLGPEEALKLRKELAYKLVDIYGSRRVTAA